MPQRDELEIRLLKLLLPKNTPVLGICRGLQIINAGMGGTLVRHVPKVYGCVHQQEENDPPFVHEVTLTPGSRTATIFGTEKLMTNSYHHQSAREVAPGLVAVGKAGEVIEALEMPGDRFLVCLQWHPEKTLGMDEYSILPSRPCERPSTKTADPSQRLREFSKTRGRRSVYSVSQSSSAEEITSQENPRRARA